jgi:uncharacterized YccA/Bax inhibitor family protein
MDLDLSRIIGTVLVIFVTVLAAERTGFAKTASRPKRALTACIIVFVVLFLLNMIWPEAATTG